ncbi:MAG: hypothetical protein PHH32_04135 [Eubacteriales bacterium]|nr:hypothetical protein [Eubacteriales bacterium]
MNQHIFNELIVPGYRQRLWPKWAREAGKRKPFSYQCGTTAGQGKRKWVLEKGPAAYGENELLVFIHVVMYIKESVRSPERADVGRGILALDR